MRLLVCGGRTFGRTDIAGMTEADVAMALVDRRMAQAFLDGVHAEFGIEDLIEGKARGGDEIGCNWAALHLAEEHHHQFPADFRQFGRGAGPIRNRQMRDNGRPTHGVAFKNGYDWTRRRGGTENMVSLLLEVDVPVWVVGRVVS